MEVSFGFGAAGLFLAIAWYYVTKLRYANPLDTLERLSRLKNEGALDDEQFEALRDRQVKRLKSID